jgi:hypothetical protein
MKRREEKVQLAVCKYIAMQYKDVIFNCDVGSGIRLPIGVAKKAKMMRSSRGYPDLFIAEPRGMFSGLYIEIKKEGAGVWLKDGSLSKNKHIQEQANMLDKLVDRGYLACFGVGFDMCKEIIDDYMIIM